MAKMGEGTASAMPAPVGVSSPMDPPPPYRPDSRLEDQPSTAMPIEAGPTSEPPPQYSVAAKLPSYEESERAQGLCKLNNPSSIAPHHIHRVRGIPGFTVLAFPRGDPEDPSEDGDELQADALLGNDLIFFTGFVTSFLFNWVGFLVLMCFCHTIAARYGALAGFGLSLTKWTMIVKKSTTMASTDNSWLWWLIMAFGLLICVRAIIQYLQIKRSWPSLSPHARERMFFFY